jgi:hypothetical protein
MPARDQAVGIGPSEPRLLRDAPPELMERTLVRLGEGIGKVVYGSPRWVVRRDRSPAEIVALIVLWKALRRIERVFPAWARRRLTEKPSRQIRFLRVMIQKALAVLPRSWWFTTHVREVWKLHRRGSARGERLAEEYLTGSRLVPERVKFPPTRVRIPGWPGYLVVSEAAERVEATLLQKLHGFAGNGRFEQVEEWLNRFLEARQAGWRRGLFSTDAHLKNYGVSGNRIVLLDTGGLTDRWEQVESRLAFEDTVERPHARLGLGELLAARPDIAERFDARWKATVNREAVRRWWRADVAGG